MATIPPNEPVTICDCCGKQDTEKYKFIYQLCSKCRKPIDVCLEKCSADTPLVCKNCKGGQKV